jgi:hypothetical protein
MLTGDVGVCSCSRLAAVKTNEMYFLAFNQNGIGSFNFRG